MLHFIIPILSSLQLRRAEILDISINGKAGRTVPNSIPGKPAISPNAQDTFFVPVSLQLDLHSVFSNALLLVLLDKRVKIAFDGRVKLKRDGIRFQRPFPLWRGPRI